MIRTLISLRRVPRGTARGAMLVATALCAASLLTFAIAPQTQEKPQVSMARFFPHGAILYLEAKDFASLLHDWNTSLVKTEWLASANYFSFSQSRLFLRLQEAQKEFASAAGIPVDSQLLYQSAGTQSAIAIYDIGELHFLCVSKIDSAPAMQSALWQSRGKFEPRSAAGAQFFVRNNGSNREVAFAIDGDSLLLATQEQLLAGALEARHGGSEPTLADERWFSSAVGAAQEPGDLRLVLDMPEIAKSPHFRSYWIQRNVSELKQYSAAISDLYRERDGLREERVLLRNPDAAQGETRESQGAGDTAAAALASAAGTGFGMSRAVANPTTDEVASSILEKLLAPKTAAMVDTVSAPIAPLTDSVTGSAEDLETKIDDPVRATAKAAQPAPELRQLLETAGVNAMLLGQSTRADATSGFIRVQSLIVLSANHEWEIAAAQNALTAAAEDLSSNRLGLNWVQNNSDNGDIFELDGQLPLYIAVRGQFLFIANSSDALRTFAPTKLEAVGDTTISSDSRISFQAERANFITLARAVDSASFRSGSARNSDDSAPAVINVAPGGFLSSNIGSLVHMLRGIASESLTRRASGAKVRESAYYEFGR